jgi:hypothetical protein
MADFPAIQEAWIWPDSIERWVRERAEGRTLHVCCGRSTLGDVRVDADPDNDPDIIGDAKRLPVEPATFDTGVIDPPWTVNVFDRPDWFFPVVEAVKPDGVILTNTTWLPTSHQTVVKDAAVRQDTRKGRISLLTEQRRYADQTTLPD